MHQLPPHQLLDDQKYQKNKNAAGTQKALPVVQKARVSQRDEINLQNPHPDSAAGYCLRPFGLV